jgi:hypothetical protein
VTVTGHYSITLTFSMRYQKGSFVTVPNKNIMQGQDPQTQVLFMWLCSYADEDGFCHPSIARLMRDCGMGRNTVIRRLEVLLELGVITRSHRFSDNKKTSNQYQIMLVSSPTEALPQSQSGTTPSATVGHRTKSNRTKSSELNTAGEPAGVPASDIVDIIDLFEPVNKQFDQWYKNKVQRAAVARCIELYTKPVVQQAVMMLVKSNRQPYFPTITTPRQLEEGWSKLEAAYTRMKNQTSNNIIL